MLRAVAFGDMPRKPVVLAPDRRRAIVHELIATLYPDEPSRDIARRVEVTPAGATIVYVHPAFTVTERLFAPLNEPAVVAVLEVDAVRPLEILARFRPDLQYAWPAGLGGQYVFWDDREKAFVLSESRGQVNGFFGSPSATWATNNPSHMLADAPSELHIAAGGADQMAIAMPKPGEPAGRLTDAHAGGAGIPIVIVGAVAPRDTVRAIYRRVLRTAEALYAARAAHAQALLDSTLVLDSPDSVLDRAVRWMVSNRRLPLDVPAEIARFKPGVTKLLPRFSLTTASTLSVFGSSLNT